MHLEKYLYTNKLRCVYMYVYNLNKYTYVLCLFVFYICINDIRINIYRGLLYVNMYTCIYDIWIYANMYILVCLYIYIHMQIYVLI